jgi:diadenosine tetraphosphate (Ap4A) HIT family hydrolase
LVLFYKKEPLAFSFYRKGFQPMPVKGLGDYDDQNIFAKILRDEIPSNRVYEDEWAVAFRDINPQAAVHVLVIPRGGYVSLADFTAKASSDEIAGFFRAVGAVARQLELEEPGYRVLTNMGVHAGQEVPHFHVHLFGGGYLGPMLQIKGR